MKPETRLYRDWQARFASLGWFEKVQQVGKRGTPDHFGCVKGRFVALEWKKEEEGGKVSPLQSYKLRQVKKNGGLAFKVDEHNVEEVYRILKEL